MYSDPYEDWKEQGRPGNYNDWVAAQRGTPAPSPAPSPMPTPAPGPQPGGYDAWVANGSIPNPNGGPNYSLLQTRVDRGMPDPRLDPRNNRNDAQTFFNQQSAADQAAILASWAPTYRIGNDAASMTFSGDRAQGLNMQDWYRNAFNAGSVPGYQGNTIRDLAAPPAPGPSLPPYEPYNNTRR